MSRIKIVSYRNSRKWLMKSKGRACRAVQYNKAKEWLCNGHRWYTSIEVE